MKENPEIKVSVEAHTDSDSDDAHNLDLSNRRAASVVKYLRQKNIDGSRLKSQGFGESRPLVPNVSKAAKAKNRRVEFVILNP